MGLAVRLLRLLLLELPVMEHPVLLVKQKSVLGCLIEQTVLLRFLERG